MKQYIMTLLFAIIFCMPVFGMQVQNDINSSSEDSSLAEDKVEKFRQRYNNYLSSLDMGAVSEASSLREHSISFESLDEVKLLHPTKNFFKLDIPGYLLLTYFLSFKDNDIVEVNIKDITIYDSGFTVIYNEDEGEKSKNYYGIKLNIKAIEEKLLHQLVSRKSELDFQNNQNYKDVELLIFYNQEL